MIKANKDRYPISAMCHILRMSRSHYYTYKDDLEKVDSLTDRIKVIIRDNKKTHGTRRIKSAIDH